MSDFLTSRPSLRKANTRRPAYKNINLSFKEGLNGEGGVGGGGCWVRLGLGSHLNFINFVCLMMQHDRLLYLCLPI